jgi:hypothetical protein
MRLRISSPRRNVPDEMCLQFSRFIGCICAATGLLKSYRPVEAGALQPTGRDDRNSSLTNQRRISRQNAYLSSKKIFGRPRIGTLANIPSLIKGGFSVKTRTSISKKFVFPFCEHPFY